MGDVNRTEDLWSKIRDLERRIVDMERVDRLKNATFTNGAVVIKTPAEELIGIIGMTTLSPYGPPYDNSLGLLIQDPSTGMPALQMDTDNGWGYPFMTTGWAKSNDYYAVTSGTFIPTWSSTVELMTHTSAKTHVVVLADSGTTGEIRLGDSVGFTSPITIASGSFSTYQFSWLTNIALNFGPITFTLEARRTSGAGNIYVYNPNDLALGFHADATATGV